MYGATSDVITMCIRMYLNWMFFHSIKYDFSEIIYFKKTLKSLLHEDTKDRDLTTTIIGHRNKSTI